MTETDRRPWHLGWIETALQTANPDLPHLALSGQAHYGPGDRLAFVDVFGVDHDRARRRRLRAEASDLLRRLGYVVELEPGRDVYDVKPIRPSSAHEKLRMLRDLRAARDRGG